MIDTLGSAAALGNSPCWALGISSRGLCRRGPLALKCRTESPLSAIAS